MKERIELNKNDEKLIGFCFYKENTVADISRYLKISPKNVSVRLPKLERAGLVKIQRFKNKTYVRSIQGDKTKKYFLEILTDLEKAGGIISEEEYSKLLPFTFDEPEGRDKFGATTKLMFTYPKLVEVMIKITPAGKKFLEDNKHKGGSK